MRERQLLKVDRHTGDATLVTEVIDDDASFAERIAGLKESAAVKNLGPVEARFLALTCNGCGTTSELDFENPRLPDGWAATDAGDVCPRCQVLN